MCSGRCGRESAHLRAENQERRLGKTVADFKKAHGSLYRHIGVCHTMSYIKCI